MISSVALSDSWFALRETLCAQIKLKAAPSPAPSQSPALLKAMLSKPVEREKVLFRGEGSTRRELWVSWIRRLHSTCVRWFSEDCCSNLKSKSKTWSSIKLYLTNDKVRCHAAEGRTHTKETKIIATLFSDHFRISPPSPLPSFK